MQCIQCTTSKRAKNWPVNVLVGHKRACKCNKGCPHCNADAFLTYERLVLSSFFILSTLARSQSCKCVGSRGYHGMG